MCVFLAWGLLVRALVGLAKHVSRELFCVTTFIGICEENAQIAGDSYYSPYEANGSPLCVWVCAGAGGPFVLLSVLPPRENGSPAQWNWVPAPMDMGSRPNGNGCPITARTAAQLLPVGGACGLFVACAWGLLVACVG